jgi:hypothetical protein
MDNSNEILDWVIQLMWHKADRVDALLEQVVQPVGSLSPEEVMKLNADVVDEMDHLVHDSLQC